MVNFEPAPGEKLILDEDCAEDKLRNGILILTNRRLVFQKTQGRIATLSKREGDVVIDIMLDKISDVRSEGFLVKKLVVSSGDMIYKFGVYSNGRWERQMNELRTGAS